MCKSQFTEEQITGIPKLIDAGQTVDEVCRQRGSAMRRITEEGAIRWLEHHRPNPAIYAKLPWLTAASGK